MNDRYCPFCGELVQSSAVTCPKCYKKIPPEPEMAGSRPHRSSGQKTSDRTEKTPRRRKERAESRPRGSGRVYNRRTAVFLNLIPGFFGLVGLGQIYRDYKGFLGYFMLLAGLALFGSSTMLLMHWTPSFLANLFSSLSAFPLMLVYALLYLFGLLDIVLGRLIHMNAKY